MPEITLRDLCRWDRRLQVQASAGASLSDALDRGVSWVVSVRTSAPLLPPLRGDELVVLSRRVLDQITETQMADWDQLLATLADQRICALLTEPGLVEEPVASLPIVTMAAPFPQDAEGTLNRLLTERRAELYRLGNDLSRNLSQAAIDPQGIRGILDVAAQICGRPIALQDGDGLLIAQGGSGDAPLAPAEDLERASDASGPSTIANSQGEERLIVPMRIASSVAYLTVAAPEGMLTEVDRLVLTQTAGTAAIVLAQGSSLGVRGARQQAIAELLEGSLASETAAIARARGLGIEPSRPLLIGLVDSPSGLEQSQRVAEQLLGGMRVTERVVINGHVAFLVPEADMAEFDQRLARVVARQHTTLPRIALAQPVGRIVEAVSGLRQAKFVLGLMRAGIIDGPVVRADSLDEIGVFGLLYHLWGNPAVDAFREDVLGALERYDERRGTELIETLRAYLSSGGSVAEAAAILSVHRNTLSYRVNRIAELSGRDLNNPQDRLLLRVALLCLDLTQVEAG